MNYKITVEKGESFGGRARKEAQTIMNRADTLTTAASWMRLSSVLKRSFDVRETTAGIMVCRNDGEKVAMITEVTA